MPLDSRFYPGIILQADSKIDFFNFEFRQYCLQIANVIHIFMAQKNFIDMTDPLEFQKWQGTIVNLIMYSRFSPRLGWITEFSSHIDQKSLSIQRRRNHDAVALANIDQIDGAKKLKFIKDDTTNEDNQILTQKFIGKSPAFNIKDSDNA